MELLTHRYRSLTVLVLVIVAQILLLGYQVRTQEDVRLVRIWVVTAITPAARMLEATRSGITSTLDSYISLVGVHQENEQLREELNRLKVEHMHLNTELAAAERAAGLSAFQQRIPSKTVTARIIGTDPAPDTRVVYIDKGSSAGIERDMALITPDGLAGRILAVYPDTDTAQAVLITDPSFAAGVVSQTHFVEGTLRGQGTRQLLVDHVHPDETVDVGEWFYTSGDDRRFPRGLPVGVVESVEDGPVLKRIVLRPATVVPAMEEVLVVLEPAHQEIPDTPPEVYTPRLLPPPVAVERQPEASERTETLSTDADRVLEQYRNLGRARGRAYGSTAPQPPPQRPAEAPETAGTAEP